MDNKKKDKTINDNSALIDIIRREYSELYKENQNLKLAVQNYERYYNDQELDNYNDYNKRPKYIQKKCKRKRRYQKPYNSSSSKSPEDEEIIVPRRKKRRQKKVYYDDVDGDANEVYTYYDLTSPTDNDDGDNIDDNEKRNVKTVKIIQKPTKKQKKGIKKSIKV